jgi:hypothetical protein
MIETKNNFIEFGFDPFKFIEDGLKIVTDNNLRSEATESRVTGYYGSIFGKDYNWYGYKSSSTKSFAEQFDINSGLGSFLDQDLLTKVEDIYSNINAKLDLGGDAKQQRIKFTDRPLGIFSFSQASKGLIRPVEYYSKTENKIISPNDVFEGQIKEMKYFYYLKDDKEILVERRQEGTTQIKDNCESVILKLDAQSNLILPYDADGKIVNECKGAKLRYASLNKKVYAYREKKGGGIAPYVDLYVSTGGTGDLNPEEMIIRSLPNILLSRILEKAGVRVRIFAYWSNRDYSKKRDFNTMFMLKNYGETININKIAVFTSDTRFYRYWLANSTIGWYYKMCGDDKSGFSTTGTLDPSTFMREILPKVRNYVSYKIKNGEFPSQVVDKRLMLFANMDVTDSDKIESPDIEKEIIKKFYSILDYIQITLSKTPRNVIKDIVKRETDAGKSLYDIKRYLKSTITDILTPTNELQQDSPEELKRKLQEGQLTKKEFDKKLAVSIQLDSVEEADKIIDARDRYNDIINNLIT